MHPFASNFAMKHIPIFFVALLCSATILANEEFVPLFPFSISFDAPDNIANISAWNDVPAGKHGFIRIENGTFVHNQGRFLIWGTNLCFSANFPEKEQAEKLAARLARFGFNCVRLHHMDNRDIWGNNPTSLLALDPQQLDRLDYLIYQLKLRGIYTDINLHVSRKFDDRDGFPHSAERPDYDKGLDNFYPPFIELQKKYARDFLTHINPYTKTTYANEPAVAMIEINNENSIVAQWGGSRDAKIMTMPAPYITEFQKQWNVFLKRKYETDEALAKAWKFQNTPLGEEILRGNSEQQKWNLEVNQETVCRASETDGVFRLEVEKHGRVSWNPQLNSRMPNVEEGKLYTFSIKAKADKPVEVSIGLRRNEGEYDFLGFSTRLPLTTEWQTFKFTFVPSETSQNVRFDIGGFREGFIYEFSESTLKPGGSVGLPENYTLQGGTIPLINRDSIAKPMNIDEASVALPREARDDFCEFLFEIERTYWLGMYRYLKDDIKVRQPVSGTQMYYGSTTIQAQLDYADVHSYWNHPRFPGRPWDQNNWTISNRALVNYLDREILSHLATARPHGIPYTVSEFDAPYPNQYGVEALPVLAAFGRFQDWDGFFHFAYSHNKGTLEPKKVTSFFDMVGYTTKLAHMPACVAMFVRGDVAKGESQVLGRFDAATELTLFQRQTGPWNFNFSGIGLDPRLALVSRTALEVVGDNRREDERTFPIVPNEISAIGNEMHWLPSTNDLGRKFLIKSANTKLFTGFSNDGEKYDLEGVELTVGKTRLSWATISLVSMNGNGFDPAQSADKPIRILVAATGVMQNTDYELEVLPDNNVTHGNRIGNEPVLCEGIPFSLRFEKAKEVRCYPLDESGNRREEVNAESNNVALGPEHNTVWYEIEVQ